MDPLSQGVLGGIAPQAVAKNKKELVLAGVIGFLAGLLPDIDIFIRSDKDPLLFLEYHRQFTHALIFIPVGGLIVALLLYPFLKKRLSFRKLYLFAAIGYGTHGLLDACTTYGTQLFWPFSNYRVAWNYISIVDPLFTLPLLVFFGLAVWKKKVKWAKVGLGYALIYMSAGWLQHLRAVDAGYELAAQRGHQPQRLEAKPTLGNLFLWKLVYEVEDRFYVDAVRVIAEPKFFAGQSIEQLNIELAFPSLDPESQQYQDILRFKWFSNGYIALHPHENNVVGDIRYSLVPNDVDPLWGVRISPDEPMTHVSFENFRSSVTEKRTRFLEMLIPGQAKAESQE